MKRLSQLGSSNFCPELRKNAFISQLYFSNFALHMINAKIQACIKSIKPSFHKVVICRSLSSRERLRQAATMSLEVLIIIDEKIKMAAINKEFLLQLNLFVLLAIMCQQKKRKKHRFWVREIFQERQEPGAYHRLIMGRVVSLSVDLSYPNDIVVFCLFLSLRAF